EKGERVGLYAAGGIAFLMIVLSLFLPGKGLLSGSPKERAQKITDDAKKKRSAVDSARPSDADKKQLTEIDPKLLQQASSAPQDAADARIPEVFAARPLPTSGRQKPTILAPEEFLAQAMPLQVSVYMTSSDRDNLMYAIKSESKKAPGKQGQTLFDRYKQFQPG